MYSGIRKPGSTSPESEESRDTNRRLLLYQRQNDRELIFLAAQTIYRRAAIALRHVSTAPPLNAWCLQAHLGDPK